MTPKLNTAIVHVVTSQSVCCEEERGEKKKRIPQSVLLGFNGLCVQPVDNIHGSFGGGDGSLSGSYSMFCGRAYSHDI